MKNTDFKILDHVIKPGQRVTVALPAPSLYTQTPMNIPVHIYHGKKFGPRLFVIAAIHGDEVNGVEIVRRLNHYNAIKHIRGTLITIPIVNVYGLIQQSRYLPDRRDLNRSFPGSKKGSLSARLANVLMEEIVSKCTHGIDLHTGSMHRINLPQIRVNLEIPGALECARAFNVPVIMESKLRDGSLRQAAAERGLPLLVYEAGEALRFDEGSIRIGVKGILNVLRLLEMLPSSSTREHKRIIPKVAYESQWSRAPESGIFKAKKTLGSVVNAGEIIGVISDPFSATETPIVAVADGIVIGMSKLPFVNEGDAVFHIGYFRNIDQVVKQLDKMQDLWK